MPELRASYTLDELARMMGLGSARVLEKILKTEGVPIRGGQKRRVPRRVWISDLRACMPEAYDSLLLKLAHEDVKKRLTG